MAVPANARVLRGAPLKVGVVLGMSPTSDPTFDLELARATSSGVYATIARLTPKGSGIPVSYTDLLPDDNTIRLYKARAVKDGWDAGDYTSAITAKPVMLPEIPPNITPLTGRGIGSVLFVSTGAPPQYGTVENQTYVDKTLTVNGFEFWSQNSYTANDQMVAPATTVSSTFFWKSLLPGGSSVQQLRLTYNRPSTKGSIRFRLQSYTTGGGTVNYIDYTATGFGAGSTFTKTFTSGVSVPEGALFNLRVQITSTLAVPTQLRPITFLYRQPTVAVSI